MSTLIFYNWSQPLNLVRKLVHIHRKVNNSLREINPRFKLFIVGQVDLLLHVPVFGQQVAARGRVTCLFKTTWTFLTHKVCDLVYRVRLVLQNRLGLNRGEN